MEKYRTILDFVFSNAQSKTGRAGRQSGSSPFHTIFNLIAGKRNLQFGSSIQYQLDCCKINAAELRLARLPPYLSLFQDGS